MKLHLPSKLQRSVIACVALAASAPLCTAGITGTLVSGLCLLSWNSQAADEFPWDSAWGEEVTAQAPTNLPEVEPISPGDGLSLGNDDEKYRQENEDGSFTLGAYFTEQSSPHDESSNGEPIAGGYAGTPPFANDRLKADIWMDFTGGQYHSIIGGHYGIEPTEDTAYPDFVGNTHIVIRGNTSAIQVAGGHFGIDRCQYDDPTAIINTFRGNSYVSIQGGDVIFACGGNFMMEMEKEDYTRTTNAQNPAVERGYTFDSTSPLDSVFNMLYSAYEQFRDTTEIDTPRFVNVFDGDSMVVVRTLLGYSEAAYEFSDSTPIHTNGWVDYIAGGNAVTSSRGMNINDFTNAISLFRGDSGVYVDLKGKEGEFNKRIIGGDYAVQAATQVLIRHEGNTSVTITNADKVTFTDRIIGGNAADHSFTTIDGDTHVKLDSGHYKEMVVAGMNQGTGFWVDWINGSVDTEQPQTTQNVSYSAVIHGSTHLDISGGTYDGAMGIIIDTRSLIYRDENRYRSIGRISAVGGNMVCGDSWTMVWFLGATNSVVEDSTHVNITGGTFTGHIAGGSVLNCYGYIDVESRYMLANYHIGESNLLFKNAIMKQETTAPLTLDKGSEDELTVKWTEFEIKGWTPRLVGGYITNISIWEFPIYVTPGGYLHLADLGGAQIDELAPGNYWTKDVERPGIKVGDINVTVCGDKGKGTTTYDIVGGSWTPFTDLIDFRILNMNAVTVEARKGEEFKGLEQGKVKISIQGDVKVKGDVIAAGIQGGLTPIITESTKVEIGSGVCFKKEDGSPTFITGGYLSALYYDESALDKEEDKDIGLVYPEWAERKSFWSSFYKLPDDEIIEHLLNDFLEGDDEKYTLPEGGRTWMLSYVKGNRELNFTDAVSYGDHLSNAYIVNFDKVEVKRVKALGASKDEPTKGVDTVTVGALMITDTGLDGSKDTITISGGGQLAITPDYITIDDWEWSLEALKDVWLPTEDRRIDLYAPTQKKVLNNTPIRVVGEGTTLHLTPKQGSGASGPSVVQSVIVERGAHLLADLAPDSGASSELLVQDALTFNGGSLDIWINLTGNAMSAKEDAGIRKEKQTKSADAASIIFRDAAELSVIIRSVEESKLGEEVYIVLADEVAGSKEGTDYQLSAVTQETMKKWFANEEASVFVEDDNSLVIKGKLIDIEDDPGTDDPGTDDPGTDGPGTDGPGTDGPGTDGPGTDGPGTDGPGTDGPGTDGPGTDGPGTDGPGTDGPGTDGPGTDGPGTDGPGTDDPGTDDPGTDGPGTDDPGTDDPGTDGPGGYTPGYHEKGASSAGGIAGGKLLDDYYPHRKPESNGDKDKTLDRVFELNVAGKTTESDRLQAAVAGVSLSAVGMAVADDVDRQLRLMRNRSAKSLCCEAKKATPEKRTNLWLNAESDYRQAKSWSTEPGYRVNAWGGTVGAAYDLSDTLETGLAITAMYGDLTTQGPDTIKGDLDTQYLSAFLRMEKGRWTHSFIATVGLVNVDATRSVNIGGNYGSYSTSFETEGYALGLMYELGYTFLCGSENTASLQSVLNVAWRHVELDGFTESGSDAALRAASQQMDTLIVGAGLRGQAVMEGMTSSNGLIIEMRALVKGYLGDVDSTANVSFADRRRSADIHNRKAGSLGAEVGITLTLPLTPSWRYVHSIFVDTNLELREAYRNENITLGYKLSF